MPGTHMLVAPGIKLEYNRFWDNVLGQQNIRVVKIDKIFWEKENTTHQFNTDYHGDGIGFCVLCATLIYF